MIEFQNVHLTYPGASAPALSSVNLVIDAGTTVAVMGANGSGKSTLVRCMNATLIPDTGKVLVDGLDTADKENHLAIRRKVGVVFQHPHLQCVASTVEAELAFGLENLELPSEEIRNRVRKQVSLFHLEHLRHRHPMELSAGEQQRVVLAAVMLMEPQYLVLDEPTTFLAPGPGNMLLRLAAELRERCGTAVIHVTQKPKESLLAHRLLILHRGRIHMDASPRILLTEEESLVSLGIPVPLFCR